ncbi:MAG: 2,3-diaminopropionate biosynthesis protein SbnB [Acidobacteria bacterium]|nr:MAG: 2,3-diaminopropionate biosynthesis protein SbnB [Acidobacteriota bacterium]
METETGTSIRDTVRQENNGVRSAPSFFVVPGATVKRVMDDHKSEVFDAVETAYRLHGSGQSVNPDSYFLRYPDKPSSRIIALPAHLGGQVQKSGIKWISSFPENRSSNLARASAVLILNDPTTGYPIACIEASLISATRTAASAALAAENISPDPFKGTLGVIGTGVIARTTVEWLLFRKWKFNKVNLYDVDRGEAEQFGNWLRDVHDLEAVIHDRLDDAVTESSLILFATTTLEPYFSDEKLFSHSPTVLHLSLRDICPNVILASQNIVDDVEHSLKAKTSLHLAEMEVGNRDFVAGTLVDVLEKKVEFVNDRPRIFSPFGLGVLDLGVGNFVYEAARSAGSAMELPHFFSNSSRW